MPARGYMTLEMSVVNLLYYFKRNIFPLTLTQLHLTKSSELARLSIHFCCVVPCWIYLARSNLALSPTSARLVRALIIGVGNLSLPVADGRFQWLHVADVSGSIWYAVGDALTATPAVYRYNSKFSNLVGRRAARMPCRRSSPSRNIFYNSSDAWSRIYFIIHDQLGHMVGGARPHEARPSSMTSSPS